MALSKISVRKLLLLLGDVFLASIAFGLALLIRVERELILTEPDRRVYTLVFFLLSVIISFYIFDLYNVLKRFRFIRTLKLMMGASLLISIQVVFFFYISPYKFGRGIFLISLFLTVAFATGWRMVSPRLFHLAVPPRNALVIGTDKSAGRIGALLSKNLECRIAGYIAENPTPSQVNEERILGDIHSLKTIVRRYGIQDIIIAPEPLKNTELIRSLVDCRLWGVRVSDIPKVYEQWMQKIPLAEIDEEWLLRNEGFSNIGSRVYDRAKRLIDMVLSSILLLLALPIGFLISILIKIGSKGPIFYTQERIGKNYKAFRLIKFRTMVHDAEKHHPKWTVKNDHRVTRLGRILRKIRLDELPQFLNIIKGEMSLIGPRPERKFFVDRLIEKIPFYSLRFSVKPGLTGWAQVNSHYASSIEETMEKLSYDLYYIKNMSLFLDLRIFMKTIRTILFSLGR